MLDIDSNQNDYKIEFSFSKIYIKEVLWINALLLIIISTVLNLTLFEVFLVLVLLIFSSIILLYFLGLKRRKQIEKISSLILSIKSSKQIVDDDIVLDSHLQTIEKKVKEMYKINQKDIADMKKLAQARTDFLGNVSHELRTPIFTIQGFLETLLNGAIDDKEVNRRFLKKAVHHTKNLDALLNDLIDISMIESGQMRMLPTYFNISKTINFILEELESYISDNNAKIEVKFFNTEVCVFGDKDKIKQVLINLISNAIKYSNNGKTIIIRTTGKDEKVKIAVSDHGFGISEVDLPRIFERFYRVDKARSKAAGGTGLGLAIVKHIVEAHGSQIGVTSKLGKGSTFSFSLRKK